MNTATLTLIDLLAKGTAVLLLGYGSIALLHRGSAAQRSLAWLAAFAALLLLPLAALVRPVWTLPVVIAASELAQTQPIVHEPMAEVQTVTTPSAVALPEVKRMAAWSLWQGLAAIYLAGVAAVLAFRLIGSWQLHRLKASATRADAGVEELMAQLAVSHRLRRRVCVIVSDCVDVPMTWGTVWPVLLLPASHKGWSVADLRAALAHELAHICHGDAAWRWLGTLVTALWWPHPLVWLSGKAWRLEQERACDDAVVRAGCDTEQYAGQLLDAARSLRLGRCQSAAALVMAMPSGLETRLRAVVGDGVNRASAGRLAACSAAAMSLALVLLCALCQAQSIAADDVNAGEQIVVSANFISMSEQAALPLDVSLEKAAKGEAVTLDEASSQALLKQIVQKKGINLLSRPILVVKPGQQGTIETLREFVYPTALAKDGVTPTMHDISKLGITLGVTATTKTGGDIELALVSTMRDFVGWRWPSQPEKVIGGIADASKAVRKGELAQPVFSERKITSSVEVKQKQWLILGLAPPEMVPGLAAEKQPSKKRVWLMVSARTVRAVATKTTAATKTMSPATPVQPANAFHVKAKQLVLPRVQFKNAKLSEAVEYLRRKSVEIDPAKNGLNILLRASDKGDPEITLDVSDVRFSEALGYVAQLSGSVVTYESYAVLITPQANKTKAPVAAPQTAAPKAVLPATDLTKRAAGIILPSVEFREASVEEALEFFRVKARDLDPAKQGVNILLKAGDPAKAVELTLSLKNVPLTEALRYVAELANLELQADDNAFLLKERGGQ